MQGPPIIPSGTVTRQQAPRTCLRCSILVCHNLIISRMQVSSLPQNSRKLSQLPNQPPKSLIPRKKKDVRQVGEGGSETVKNGGANKCLRTIVVQYNFQFKEQNSSMEGANGKPVTEEVISNAVENIFQKYDQNHNNFIDFSQFRKLIEDLNLSPRLRVSLREITSIFKLLDVDGDGRVSREQLIGALCEVKDIAM